MVSSTISKNYRLSMGDSASQPNAQDLRNVIVGLSRFEQLRSAIQWAKNVLASGDGLAIFVIDADVILSHS